jgi:serine/threonine protein kinase
MSATEGQAGSWPYLPREQLLDARDVRPATDVWSVAATFYEMLAGAPPRDVGARDPVAAVLETRPAPVLTRVPGLAAPVAQVIDRALEMDVARRYRDAGELRDALVAALEEPR